MKKLRKGKAGRKSFIINFLMTFLLFQPISAFSMVLEVSVTSAGNLINQVNLAQIDQITNLTLHGELNGTDILVIRKMKGLEYLDITDTKIVNGGDSYYEEYTTSEDVIGSYFFNNPNLITLYLPNTINSIEEYAFDRYTSLKTVFIGTSTMYIRKYAFRGCGITNLEIPESVTYIADYAFSECKELEDLRICDSEDYMSFSDKAFSDCGIKQLYIGRDCGKNYNNSYNFPFQGLDSLKNVIIGKQVSHIGHHAFVKCGSLEELRIEDSVDSLDFTPNFAFGGSPIEKIYMGRNIADDYALDSPFSGIESLKVVQIGDSVTRIHKYAFMECIGLNAIVIPNSVESIEKEAFSYCN